MGWFYSHTEEGLPQGQMLRQGRRRRCTPLPYPSDTTTAATAAVSTVMAAAAAVAAAAGSDRRRHLRQHHQRARLASRVPFLMLAKVKAKAKVEREGPSSSGDAFTPLGTGNQPVQPL